MRRDELNGPPFIFHYPQTAGYFDYPGARSSDLVSYSRVFFKGNVHGRVTKITNDVKPDEIRTISLPFTSDDPFPSRSSSGRYTFTCAPA